MIKKRLIFCVIFLFLCSAVGGSSADIIPGQIYPGAVALAYRNVTVYAPAVASTDEGYIGVISTITATVQSNGSGRVFVDTLPLTQIDMQGSARLAVNVASALVENDQAANISVSDYDFFFVVRTNAPVIGGPSAGAVMTLAAIAVLENWTMDAKMIMTGMINPDGSIGPVGGIIQKIDAAASVGATRFLVPEGQGTYTEMVTETIVRNGRRRVITRPVTRNVADYAMDNYGIEVVEVSDIHETLLYATGMSFAIPVSNDTILTENYTRSMEPLASSLLQTAQEVYSNASDQLNVSTIPNSYPIYYRNQITDMFNEAYHDLTEAEEWYEQQLYYSSTSNSFQSLINSRFVIYACGYFNTDDEQEYILSLLDEATALYTNKSETAKDAEINGTISLQCVGAAQQRASEAETHLDDAWTYYDGNDFLNALYKISFAVERSNSVGWWLGISSYYNDTGEINNEKLTSIAGEYIEESQQAVVYSGVILQELGRSSGYLTEAEELLEAARDNYEKDYPAAALFEALEALVKANLALEIVDGVTDDKLERARENARISISQSRSQNVEPVLAISYYEYGESLTNVSAFDSALVYYKLSDIIAGALIFTSGSVKGYSSRYVGIPERTQSSWSLFPSGSLMYAMLFLLIGGLGGLGLGLIIGSLLGQKDTNKEFYSQMPRSIEDYYKKH
jgi:uncharacterized protein